MKILKLTRLGNPILRSGTKQLTENEILGSKVQELISDMRHTIRQRQYGVGLAAPQIGEGLSLSVIGIKPTPNRPNLEPFEQIIINPSYVGIGRRTGMWEGCVSIGTDNNILYGKALRYKKIQATWYDETATLHKKELSGFPAHVFQHETDHLSGVLFVDKVRDTKTFMMADEYRKRIVKVKKNG